MTISNASLHQLLPTSEDVEFYRAHGYWISGPIVPAGVLDAAETGMARLYAGDTDRPLPGDRPLGGWRPEHGEVLRKNDYASLVVDELAALVRSRLIAACAARLSGATEIRLWHDQLLYKPPESVLPQGGGVNVGWHTDRQYWLSCASTEMLTAWVPFHDVGAAEGGISFVDASHLWPDDVALDFFDSDLSTLDRLRGSRRVEVVVPEIPRGAVSFHHCRTVHGSGPNLSGRPRRSLAVHLQPGDNHPSLRARHGNDDLVRRDPEGRPDYADPAVCPRLWPASPDHLAGLPGPAVHDDGA
ncbi:phytanoyl-CoA dioxygenase family protein [Nonomuraea sp. M3C6]|uniref:Phytanoyl-CoA dioxygenase family protein n=1 Tax=Nonomuraea marmarensis TaxID=3351344 RepID=A0ABW7AGH1_9ACTN